MKIQAQTPTFILESFSIRKTSVRAGEQIQQFREHVALPEKPASVSSTQVG